MRRSSPACGCCASRASSGRGGTGGVDRAGEALADPDPGDLDRVAGLEGLDRDRLAEDELGSATELDQVPVGLDAGLLQVAELGLRDLALDDRLERSWTAS